ncbi:MAG: hypothetical protein H0V74_00125 [Chloroflexi bacterium]|nr:hypothetical protein [Chloroflexota bacterium]
MADDGVVLLEHHQEDWPEPADDSRAEIDRVVLALTDVRREPPIVSATMVYEIDGRSFWQPFVARVLSHDELSTELTRV